MSNAVQAKIANSEVIWDNLSVQEYWNELEGMIVNVVDNVNWLMCQEFHKIVINVDVFN